MAQGSTFFVPDASPLLLMAQWVKIATSQLVLAGESAASDHNWQSRAPPSL
jgi:hypothetical protein